MAWERIGQDDIGQWPVVRLNPKKFYVQVIVRHNTPENYRSMKRWAKATTWLMLGTFVFFGIQLAQNAKQPGGEPISGQTWLILGGIAVAALFIPHWRLKRKMRNPSQGRKTRSVFTIKKGVMHAPGRAKVPLDKIHSVTASSHPKAQQEEMAEVRDRIRKNRSKVKPEIYRKSSQAVINAGQAGARKIGAVAIYNDPEAEYAGLVAAAIAYAKNLTIEVMKQGQLPTSAAEDKTMGHRPAV